jgi:hypothetical protein
MLNTHGALPSIKIATDQKMAYTIISGVQRRIPMFAIEFQAQIKNGVIEIPVAYRDQLADSVRVIILTPDRPQATGMLARLLETPLDDSTFVPMTRDEIYDGRA